MKHTIELNPAGTLTVSVVVPCYNGEKVLPATIESLLAQSQVPDEIIVVDDGSRDASAAVARRYGDRVRVVTQENAGAAHARLQGVLHARSQVVVFNDAGDISRPNRVESLARALATNPECVAAYGVTWITSRTHPTVSRVTGRPLDGSTCVVRNPFELMLARSWPIAIGMNFAVRREIAVESARISPFYRAANDYALQMNTARKGPFVHVADVLLEYEETSGGISDKHGWIQQTGYSLCAAAEFFQLESARRRVASSDFVERVNRDWPGIALHMHLKRNYALLKRVLYVGLRFGRLHTVPRRLWWALDDASTRGSLDDHTMLKYLSSLICRIRQWG